MRELRKGFALSFLEVADCFNCGGQPAIEKELDGHGAVAVTGVHCGGCDSWSAGREEWNEAQLERAALAGPRDDPRADDEREAP